MDNPLQGSRGGYGGAQGSNGAKSGVGTALGPSSRIWFALRHGIIDEILYPDLGHRCVRALELVVTDGKQLFSPETGAPRRRTSMLEDGCPVWHVVSSTDDYRLEKKLLADPRRDVLLEWVKFSALRRSLEDYQLFSLLFPQPAAQGNGTAWVGEYKGTRMLFARSGAVVMACGCSTGFRRLSAGISGYSDGWQDLVRHRRLTHETERAENSGVSLTGEIELAGTDGSFVLFVGFGGSAAEAAFKVLASMRDGYDAAETAYLREWRQWQEGIVITRPVMAGERDLFRTSAAVIRTHESKQFPGALIAGLSFPWELPRTGIGYHLVWPRELVDAAVALIAAGAAEDARRIINYLSITQENDGHWPRIMTRGGAPVWSGIQLDETAMAVLLMDLAQREQALDAAEARRLWPTVRKAAGFIACNGPVTQEARWEEDPGYSPSTLGLEIAALLAAADWAERSGEGPLAGYLRETADAWNDNIERWTFVHSDEITRQTRAAGFYAHIASAELAPSTAFRGQFIPNTVPGRLDNEAVAYVAAADALSLVRLGLRAPNDLRIEDTARVVDALLKCDTPQGSSWRRYNDDAYGEHVDGRPYDGRGVGRCWPLVTGERALYELAAGRRGEAELLLAAVESFAGDSGMIPEQVWDSTDIPEKELFKGAPTGSSRPSLAAHAGYLLLRRSLQDNRLFGQPPQTVRRYLDEKIVSPYYLWRFNNKARVLPQGKLLRIETMAPAMVRWSIDSWHSEHDSCVRETGIGMHVVELPTGELPVGSIITFTFFWPLSGEWEGKNFEVMVGNALTGEQVPVIAGVGTGRP